MSDAGKQRVRVQAGSSPGFTSDSYVNFAANLGYGTRNLTAGSTYGFNPLSRNRYKLDMMYRGSWLVRQIVDAVAEDMTRAGINIESDATTPEDEATLMEAWQAMQLWQDVQSEIKWARLYGGAIGVIMIDGADPSQPLDVNNVQRGTFKGLMVLDRWMLQPSLEEPVRALGPEFGMPRFYDVVSDAHSVPGMRVHHSRCIRMEGVDLPYWQKMSENLWGLSVIEPMFDRMIAFDSATNGAAQLVYKAHLRTLSVERLRELIAAGGKTYQAFLEQVGLIRLTQSNEGMTILDASDKFETHQYAFGGLSDLLIQFGQQLSGAAQIPLVRLFGQSPAGLNATGESDLRNYYDMIAAQQEAKLRRPITVLLEIMHRHVFGIPLPEGFSFSFRPLWQLQESEKAVAAGQNTATILSAFEGAVVGKKTVLKELREQSRYTGVWTNISDEQIKQAEEEPPDPMAAMPGQPGMPPGQPGMPGEPPPAPGEPQQRQPGEPAPTALAGQPQAHGPRRAAPPGGRRLLAHEAGAVSPTRQRVLALMGQKPAGLNGHGLNGHAPPSRLEQVHGLFGHRHNTTAARVRHILQHDQSPPLVDFHGLQCVVETEKGQRRQGNGWSAIMPCDYGYIRATGSPEGGGEQMDCYIGPDAGSDRVYIVHQHTLEGDFDEYKCMLQFPDRDAAVNAYYLAYPDGTGPQRLLRMDSMDIEGFKQWITKWPYDLHNPAGDGPRPRA